MKPIKQFAAIGEGMIELRHQDDYSLKMSFAGDTLNLATYLNRLVQSLGVQVNYITALGDDPYSEIMIADWQKEGINTEFICRLPKKMPGLYLIRTEPSGERHFYFYRSQSAARELLKGNHVEQLLTSLAKMDYLYFSNITLAILDAESREKLFQMFEQAKANGATIVFDSNYRASLWPDVQTIRKLLHRAANFIDIILPTYGDEQAIWGDTSLEACAERLHAIGIPEVVIKHGAEPCLISISGKQEWVQAEVANRIVDTTSAGDAFNAGYLAARIRGRTPVESAHFGHRLACTVIAYPGAIIPHEAMRDLTL